MKTSTMVEENIRAKHTPPTAPKDPAFQVEPPLSFRKIRASVNGGDLESARHQVIAAAKSKLETIARIDPDRSAAIGDIASQIEKLSQDWFVAVDENYHILCDYTSAVRARALCIHAVHEQEALLESAKATLDDPSSINLSGEELMVLTQRTKHLPAIIKSAWAEIPIHEARILELEERTGIPASRIVADLLEQLTGPDGRCTDLDLRRAAEYLPLGKK